MTLIDTPRAGAQAGKGAGPEADPGATVSGNDLVGRTLARLGVEQAFFLMGGPMLEAENACVHAGIRMIDVRHEQAAAMMAHAYARLLARPGVCLAASGPGAINFTTGLANALVDCAPVVALGGASPLAQTGRGAFQEIDQVAIMRPVTKWAERVLDTRRIPEFVTMAYRAAMAGKPGPVYLDLPGDVLYRRVPADEVRWPPEALSPPPRPAASPEEIERVRALLVGAERPVILSGSGIFWSGAAGVLEALVGALGVPLYTTPQGRGAVPEDHPCCMPHARSRALKEADLVLVVGTRLNFMVDYGQAPRFHPEATFVHVDIDPAELARFRHRGVPVLADASTFLAQLLAAVEGLGGAGPIAARLAPWRERLCAMQREREAAQAESLASDAHPIHPLRLCGEVAAFMDRDAILVVDGQEILNYGRQSIRTFAPAHRLNSGPFGTMGVGLPFGLGAKAAKPDAQVIVLHGDGAFGLNAMELDTAVRHNLPVLIVVSLNGGWTADPDRTKPGRDLGYTRFDRMAETLGCHGEFVERAADIRPALERARAAVARGQTALVNVVTDWRARAATANFTNYTT